MHTCSNSQRPSVMEVPNPSLSHSLSFSSFWRRTLTRNNTPLNKQDNTRHYHATAIPISTTPTARTIIERGRGDIPLLSLLVSTVACKHTHTHAHTHTPHILIGPEHMYRFAMRTCLFYLLFLFFILYCLNMYVNVPRTGSAALCRREASNKKLKK